MSILEEPPTPAHTLKLKGVVVKGFGRGSKELGIPTANLSKETILEIPAHYQNGIYYGYVPCQNFKNKSLFQVRFERKFRRCLSDGHVTRLSIPDNLKLTVVGWNPFYKNKERSAEVHIIHKFDQDFYGEELRVLVIGYIRPELDFTGVEALIEAINNDIKVALQKLAQVKSYDRAFLLSK